LAHSGQAIAPWGILLLHLGHSIDKTPLFQ